MRKIFTILLAVVMMAASAVRLSASDKFVSFGVKAGLDFTNMTKFEDIKKDGLILSNQNQMYFYEKKYNISFEHVSIFN